MTVLAVMGWCLAVWAIGTWQISAYFHRCTRRTLDKSFADHQDSLGQWRKCIEKWGKCIEMLLERQL